MKLYKYDGSTETEITSRIIKITPIMHALDQTPRITIDLLQNEGDSYDTYKDDQGVEYRIKDNTATYYFFIGRVEKVSFTSSVVSLTCTGITDKLRDKPFNQNYVLDSCKVETVNYNNGGGADVDCLRLVEDSETAGNFGWVADEWNSGEQDKGALITDVTEEDSQKWHFEATESETLGNWSRNPNPHVPANSATKAEEPLATCGFSKQTNTSGILGPCRWRIGGTDIPTTNSIRKIKVSWRIKVTTRRTDATHYSSGYATLILSKNDLNLYYTLFSSYVVPPASPVGDAVSWFEGDKEFSGADLTGLLHTTAGNYDYAYINIVGSGNTSVTDYMKIDVDFLEIEVFYATLAFTPISAKITDSGVNGVESWITCDTADFYNRGVNPDDKVVIGENTKVVINAACSLASIGTVLDTNLDKYFATNFKGVTSLSVVQRAGKVEGAKWWEGYDNSTGFGLLYMYKPANFIASDFNIDNPLTSANYGHNFTIDRDYNQVKAVEVWGNPKYSVHAIATDDDETNLSEKIYPIIDETIATTSDAQAIADAELAIRKYLNPSIMIELSGTGYESIWAGTIVYATFERPTIAKTAYKVRRVDRTQTYPNGILKTVVYLGLGETPEGEAWHKAIREAKIDIQNMKSARLVPGSEGGTPLLNHSDIQNKNAEAAFRHVTTTQVGYLPTADQKAALVGTPGTPATGNKYLTADALVDSIADADTTHAPTRNAVFDGLAGKASTTHASTHASGQSDAVKLDDLAAPDDNTDLDASTTKHGLLKKLDNDNSHFLNGQGGWTVPAGTGWLSNIVEDTTPQLGGNLDPNGKFLGAFITWRDAAAWDYTVSGGTLTADGAFHTKDASGVITAGASNVILMVYCNDTVTDVQFRKTGATNRIAELYGAVANVQQVFVPLDASRQFDYLITNGKTSYFHIVGWF